MGFVARTGAGSAEPGAATDWDAGLRALDQDLDGVVDDDLGPSSGNGPDETPSGSPGS